MKIFDNPISFNTLNEIVPGSRTILNRKSSYQEMWFVATSTHVLQIIHREYFNQNEFQLFWEIRPLKVVSFANKVFMLQTNSFR